MSTNVILIIVGGVLLLAGLVKMGHRQSGGFSLSNFGVNIGSTNNQSNKVGNITPIAAKTPKPAKPDWVGLAIAVLGLLAALIGFARELA